MRNNKRPGLQIFWPFFALLLVANGLGFSSVVLWPKPEAVTLGGLCLLASFGALIAICRAAGLHIQSGRLVTFHRLRRGLCRSGVVVPFDFTGLFVSLSS